MNAFTVLIFTMMPAKVFLPYRAFFLSYSSFSVSNNAIHLHKKGKCCEKNRSIDFICEFFKVAFHEVRFFLRKCYLKRDRKLLIMR